jgi:CIC family chloride channel protein
MLAEGIAFVALRKKSLYGAQVATQRESPVHRADQLDLLRGARVSQVMRLVSVSGIPIASREHQVRPDDDLRTAAEILLAHKLREIPVRDASGQVIGLLDEADISRYYLAATTKSTTPPPSGGAPPT